MGERQADIDDGLAGGVISEGADEICRLEQENLETKRANEILKLTARFLGAELDR